MQVRAFGKQLLREVMDDDVTDVAAMMTYYAVFALFPMILLILTIGLLVVPASAIDEMVKMAEPALPPAIAAELESHVRRMQETAGAGFAVLGAALALWGASRGAAALGSALNRVYTKKETRPWWTRQLIAIGVTLLVAVVIIVALGILVSGPAVGHLAADYFGLGAAFDVSWAIGRWVGAGALLCLVWAILYKFLPDTDAPFRVFTPGAVTGVVLWIAVSQGFAIFLANFADYEATYGTLAGAIIFLLWLWLSNLAILVGAEINDVLATFRRHESPAAAVLADETEHADRPATKRDEPAIGPRPQKPVHGGAH